MTRPFQIRKKDIPLLNFMYALSRQLIKDQIVELDNISDHDCGDDAAFPYPVQSAEKQERDNCCCHDVQYVEKDFDIFISLFENLADGTVHGFSRKHCDTALVLNPDSQSENKTAQRHQKELCNVIVYRNAADQHT